MKDKTSWVFLSRPAAALISSTLTSRAAHGAVSLSIMMRRGLPLVGLALVALVACSGGEAVAPEPTTVGTTQAPSTVAPTAEPSTTPASTTAAPTTAAPTTTEALCEEGDILISGEDRSRCENGEWVDYTRPRTRPTTPQPAYLRLRQAFEDCGGWDVGNAFFVEDTLTVMDALDPSYSSVEPVDPEGDGGQAWQFLECIFGTLGVPDRVGGHMERTYGQQGEQVDYFGDFQVSWEWGDSVPLLDMKFWTYP